MVGFFGMFYSRTVHCMFGGVGMQRTTGVMTFILPAEGAYTVSLVNPKSESFLPANWKYRYPHTLTINDSPLGVRIGGSVSGAVVRSNAFSAVPEPLTGDGASRAHTR